MPDTTVRFHYRPLPQPLRASRWFAQPRPYALEGPAQDHLVQRIERAGSFYEADLLEALDTALGGAKGTIIDVGANVGNHSVYFAAVIGASVVAVEPNVEVLPYLRRNIAANGVGSRVVVAPLALSDRAEHRRVVSGPAGNLGMARTESASAGTAGAVAAEPLDAVFSRLRSEHSLPLPVTLIKIDVEGHELAVLQGATDLLKAYRPLVAVETRDDAARSSVDQLLGPLGYRALGQYCATPTFIFSTRPAPLLAGRLRWLRRARRLLS